MVSQAALLPRGGLGMGRGGPGYPLLLEILYFFYRIPRKNKYLYSWQVDKCPGHPFLDCLYPPLFANISILYIERPVA